jgi:hypothetical protein
VISGFSRFFSTLVPETFRVENPFIWRTKTELLRKLAKHHCAEFISQTVSCSRVREMTALHTHCCVCSQCVDRRLAVLAADLDANDPETLYKLDLLADDLPTGVARTMVESYVRTASDIDRMNELAFFSRYGEASRAVRFFSETASEAGQKIFELHKRHARGGVPCRENSRLGYGVCTYMGPPSCTVR